MSREKQIEEMAKLACTCFDGNCKGCPFDFYPPCPPKASATRLYNAGYRKQGEEGAECPTCHGTGRIGTTDWLTKNISKKQLAEEKAQAIAEHEQHIKTELAREIFAELESVLCSFEYPSLTSLGNIKVIRADGWHIRAEDYRVIKKKYTEN